MVLSDEAERILDMLSARLDKIDAKLDRVVEKIPILVAHDHTSANCPLAVRVNTLERSTDRAKGALWAVGLMAVPGIGILVKWLLEWVRR